MANPYQQIAIAAARMYGVDPGIFTRQINQESGFNPNARSSAGAEGIAQFMPGTAKGYGINPYNPKQALYAAAKMDAGNLKKYGSYESMLSAYNSGNPNAYKDPNFARGETANYVKKILGGSNPYVASGGSVSPSQGTDSTRLGLLSYLMQSNNALGHHGQQPSLLPYLLAQNPAEGPAPTNSAPNVPSGTKTDASIEKFAAPYGLTVTATTNGQHAAHSYHYLGRAVDFGGNVTKMAALAKQALQTGGWTELIYTGPGNPGYSILGGKMIPNSQLPKSLYQEHTNHVHIAK